MTRQDALQFLKENLQNENLLKHCFAVEAIMSALAEKLGQDKEKWTLAGLLHDIDYEKTKNEPQNHSLIGAQILEQKNLDKEICEAVKTHNEMHGIRPESLMARALYVSDPISGLIVASTLVLPSKKIKDLTRENVLNRFKEKGFARGAKREIISQCETFLEITLQDFTEIALKAMQGIDTQLSL